MQAVTLTCPGCKRQVECARTATKCPNCGTRLNTQIEGTFAQYDVLAGKKVIVASQRLVNGQYTPPILVTDMATMQQWEGHTLDVQGPCRIVYREEPPFVLPAAGRVTWWIETEAEVTVDGKQAGNAAKQGGKVRAARSRSNLP